MQVTELSLLVAPLAQPHFDLLASSRTCKLCFANVNQLQTWDQDTVTTVAQTRGSILDVAFSPFFANYVALVTDQGEAVVKDITLSRSTFHIAPSLNEGAKTFLKLVWHTSRQTVLATAYQDGLVCVWDMSVATQNPKSVVDGVTTLERPTSTGIIYTDAPELLVAMRSPEPLLDMTMAGDYVFTVGQSGKIRVFGARRGEFIGEIADAAAKRIVVVSEAPFIIATSSGSNNEKISLWRLQTASPLKFAMTEYFEFAPIPLPSGHPGCSAPFNIMRMASKNMLIVSHPYLAALWILSVDTQRAFTFGTPQPFNGLAAHDPAEGFVGICQSAVVFAKFNGPQDAQVSLPVLTPQILTMSCEPAIVSVDPAPITAVSDVPESPSMLAAAAAAASSTPAAADQGPMITLDALKGILQRQNEICLDGLRNNRALTLKKQLHVLECLRNLPSAIMDALKPVLESAAESQKGRTDTTGIAAAVADSVKEPAVAAFGSYFKEALIPGYVKACNFMASDIQDAVDSGANRLANSLTPAYTAAVIDPLVQGLAQASGKLTHVYKSQTSGSSNVNASTTTSTTSQPSVNSTPAVVVEKQQSTTSKDKDHHSSGTTSNAASTTSTATSTVPAVTPVKKKNKNTHNTATSSPAPAASTPNTHTNNSNTNNTSTTSHPAPTPIPASPQNNLQTQLEKAAVPIVETAPSPPRPDPKPTVPISDAIRNSLTTLINQKQWTEAVNIVLDTDNVEALGYLTSRTDMGWWVDDIAQTHLEVLLFMILKQTEWPSSSQLAKYKKTVLLILAKLDPSTLSNSPTTHEMLQLATQWTSGTPIEAAAREQIDRLAAAIKK